MIELISALFILVLLLVLSVWLLLRQNVRLRTENRQLTSAIRQQTLSYESAQKIINQQASQRDSIKQRIAKRLYFTQ